MGPIVIGVILTGALLTVFSPSRRPTGATTTLGRPPAISRSGPTQTHITVVAGATSALLLVGGSFVLGTLAGVAALAVPRLLARQAAIRRAAELAGALPAVMDLLIIVLAAGGSLGNAFATLERSGPPITRESWRLLRARTGAGESRRDALNRLPEELGSNFIPLIEVLHAADREGASVNAVIDRLSSEARRQRAQRLETDARKTPVRMLAPLSLCSLPAALVGTVIPLVVIAVDSTTF